MKTVIEDDVLFLQGELDKLKLIYDDELQCIYVYEGDDSIGTLDVHFDWELYDVLEADDELDELGENGEYYVYINNTVVHLDSLTLIPFE